MKTAKQAFRIFLSIFYILAVIFVVDSAFGVFMRGPGKPHDKLNYMIDGVDCDILIIGSSRAFRHYDAKMMSDSLGVKVYNAGYDGVNSAFILPVIESFLRNVNPKMVIYEVLPWEFASRVNKNVGVLKSLYGHTDEISHQLDMAGYNQYNVLNSNLIRFNSPIPGFFSLLVTYNNNYGFESLYSGNPDLLEEEKPIDKEINESDPLAIENFNKIIKLIRDKDIPIVMVFSPCYSIMDSPVKSEQIIDSLGLPFINNFMLRFDGDPKEYFYDITHLNDKGAKLYTRHFIGQIKPYLEEYGILPTTELSEPELSQPNPSKIDD